MDVQHIEGNQAAGPKEHASTQEEVHLRTALNIANNKIASLERKISELQRAADTEKPNLRPIYMDEPAFLANMQTMVDKRLQKILSDQESDLKNQECFDRDEIVEKYQLTAHKLAKAMKLVFDVQKEKNDLFLQLKETKNKLFIEEAQHCRDNEVMEAKMTLFRERSDLKVQNLKEQHISELQDVRQSTLNTLTEEMVNLNRTNENLLTELNNAKTQLSLNEEPWQQKYTALKNRYQKKLENTVETVREKTQASLKLLDDKFKIELKRNYSLLDQLQEMHGKNEVLIDSEKQLSEANKLMKDSNAIMTAEVTLLENICLELKKKCRGIFGRRMQERGIELEKMKRKMREQMPPPTPTQTQPAFGGTTCDIDDPPPRAPYSLLKRLSYLQD